MGRQVLGNSVPHDEQNLKLRASCLRSAEILRQVPHFFFASLRMPPQVPQGLPSSLLKKLVEHLHVVDFLAIISIFLV